MTIKELLLAKPQFQGSVRFGTRHFEVVPGYGEYTVIHEINPEGKKKWALHPATQRWMECEFHAGEGQPSWRNITPHWGKEEMPDTDPAVEMADINTWFSPIVNGMVYYKMTLNEIKQPWRLAWWGHGEYSSALWLVGDTFLLKAAFRAHGHGESYLEVCRLRGPDAGQWVNLIDELPADFGRAVDKIVRQDMFHGLPPIANEVLPMCGIEITDEMKEDGGLAAVDAIFWRMLADINMESNTFQIEVAFLGPRERPIEVMTTYKAMAELNMDLLTEMLYCDEGEGMEHVAKRATDYLDNQQLSRVLEHIKQRINRQ